MVTVSGSLYFLGNKEGIVVFSPQEFITRANIKQRTSIVGCICYQTKGLDSGVIPGIKHDS